VPPGRPPKAERLPLEQRFWARVSERESGCWPWGGTRDADGYGRFRFAPGHDALAHRLAYQLTRGPLPPGWALANRCSRRACVNPAHWEMVARAEVGHRNLARTRGKGERLGPVQGVVAILAKRCGCL